MFTVVRGEWRELLASVKCPSKCNLGWFGVNFTGYANWVNRRNAEQYFLGVLAERGDCVLHRD